MTGQSVQQQLTGRVAGILGVAADAVDVSAPLHTLGLDSMRLVEMLVFVEQQFNIDLMDEALSREDIHTIEALARTIERRKA
ncbi:MAG: acyl carrier protein [Pontiellaceae bacterium]|jgi:acyl carrier protein|nr:acyl carrier protein [Pontiellaceae bacterium]